MRRTDRGIRTDLHGDPPWLDRDRYPFDSRWFDAGPGRLHYVDEGKGDHAVVAVHGNPTWSFVYRRLIRSLTPEHRVVAPDLLGFGLSEAPEAFSYRPVDHADVFCDLLDGLDVVELTLVVHDWGGSIGLSYALDNPGRVRSLVVCNSFCWSSERLPLRAFGRLVGSPLGRIACERFNAFPSALMPLAFADRSRLPPSIHSQYVGPLEQAERRTGTWVFPRELISGSEWLDDLWNRRAAVADVPALLAWGMEDPVLGRHALERFEEWFPAARTVEFEDVGHYVPEEGGEAFVERVADFLDACA